ncbi:hypothetical protein VCE7224_03524 [Vibrio celticus]|uniref:Uncharacterized protein n=1 Tax=Vibrio celticus TaxID=446372 RepID=A0A1C3JI22_9VIBR|nr:hypothetical protein VCE7224_03524 [Vibrio celticus]
MANMDEVISSKRIEILIKSLDRLIAKKTPSAMLGVSKPCGTHVGTFFVLAN